MQLTCTQTLAVGTRVVHVTRDQLSPIMLGGPRRVGVVQGAVGSDSVSVQWEANPGQGNLLIPLRNFRFGPFCCEVRTEF